MELLRFLTSPEHQRSQEELWQRVRGSYEVRARVDRRRREESVSV